MEIIEYQDLLKSAQGCWARIKKGPEIIESIKRDFIELGKFLSDERAQYCDNDGKLDRKGWDDWKKTHGFGDMDRRQESDLRQISAHAEIVRSTDISDANPINIMKKVRKMKAAEKRSDIEKEGIRLAMNGDFPITIETCAIQDADIEPGSVDAIITDPPYLKEFLPVYRELSSFAMHALKPGGWCVVMTHPMFMHRNIMDLTSRGLEYYWTVSVAFRETPRLRNYAVMNSWKPIIVLCKPPVKKPELYICDHIKAGGDDRNKELHRWQQDLATFDKLVEQWSRPGELVADPFLGSGTTAVAAISKGRAFWGCDCDEAAVETTLERLGINGGSYELD